MKQSGLEQMLTKIKEQQAFIWITLVGSEGLSLGQAGIHEPLELSALLPGWVQNAHGLAQTAGLDHGMGLICLVPEKGTHMLLIKDFMKDEERYFLIIATTKLPPQTSATLRSICEELHHAL